MSISSYMRQRGGRGGRHRRCSRCINGSTGSLYPANSASDNFWLGCASGGTVLKLQADGFEPEEGTLTKGSAWS